MNDNDPIPEPKVVLPHQLGWLRRPELDTTWTEVWELPDGQLFAAEPGKPVKMNIMPRLRREP